MIPFLIEHRSFLGSSKQSALLLCSFLLLSISIFSQDIQKEKIDSALATLSKKLEAEKKETFNFLSTVAFRAKDQSIPLFKYVLSKDSTVLAKMMLYQKMGQKHSQKGKTDEALMYYLKGLEAAKELQDERYIMEYYGAAGNAYQFLNEMDKSLKFLNEGQKIAEKPEHKDYLWFFFYQKGILQNELGNVKGQQEYYLKMWESVKEYENSSTKRFVLYNLVDFFTQVNEPEQLTFFTETLAQHYEEANPNMPQGHMPIKNIFDRRATKENISKFIKAIQISDSLDNINSLTYSAIALAETYEKIGQPEKGIPYLEIAMKKLEEVNKPQVKLGLLTKMYLSQSLAKNYKKAFQYKLLEDELQDSITSERMQRNIAELEVKFDTEKKERKILEQNLTIEKENRQKNLIIIGAVAIGLLLLTALFFYRKRLKYQKTITQQTKAIQQQKIIELEQKNKLLALNSMIEGQEAERLRIAKDLHDSLGGLLSTVKAHFTTIQNEIIQLEKLNITEKTNTLIDEACIEVRRISHNMMPHALSISGLQGAIEDITVNLREEGYEATLEMAQIPEIKDTKEVMIYRLLQEIISNIRKHAKAKSILIQLIGHQNNLTIIVEDDGHGFDYETAMQKGGLGLKSINSRVQFLDGTIDWDTSLKQGTNITINIPL